MATFEEYAKNWEAIGLTNPGAYKKIFESKQMLYKLENREVFLSELLERKNFRVFCGCDADYTEFKPFAHFTEWHSLPTGTQGFAFTQTIQKSVNCEGDSISVGGGDIPSPPEGIAGFSLMPPTIQMASEQKANSLFSEEKSGSDRIPPRTVRRFQQRFLNAEEVFNSLLVEYPTGSGQNPYVLLSKLFDTHSELEDHFGKDEYTKIILSIKNIYLSLGIDGDKYTDDKGRKHPSFAFILMVQFEKNETTAQFFKDPQYPDGFFYFENIGTPCPPICNEEDL